MDLACVQVMPIKPPWDPMQGYKLQVVAESVFRIQDMLEDKAGVDEVRGICVLACIASGENMRVVQAAANSKGLQVLSTEDALRERESASLCGRKASERREPTRRGFRAREPFAGRQGNLILDGDGGAPCLRVLHDGAVLEHERGITEARVGFPRPALPLIEAL